jgi:hypothetical protein
LWLLYEKYLASNPKLKQDPSLSSITKYYTKNDIEDYIDTIEKYKTYDNIIFKKVNHFKVDPNEKRLYKSTFC